MKIEQHRAGLEPGRIDGADATGRAATERAARPGPSASGTDHVQVSSGAQLAGMAVKAAASAPDIRDAEVERARALLDSGALGADAGRLADALIDRALEGD